MTYDDLPILGRAARVQNLVLATGHGMLGVTMSAATGLLIADLLCRSTRRARPDAVFPDSLQPMRKPRCHCATLSPLLPCPHCLSRSGPERAPHPRKPPAAKSGPVDFQWGVKIPCATA